MIDIPSFFAHYNGTVFPDFTGKNASGAGATDGTEFIAAMIDNWGWGWAQALLDYMNIVPNGVTESPGNSQIVEAITRLMPVGCIVEWNRNTDPGINDRFLLLDGQGILRADYPDLDAACYVGDANNATAAAWYRSDNAAGTIRNIIGVYLVLPESRGYAARGLDATGSTDPEGATRTLGSLQQDDTLTFVATTVAELVAATNTLRVYYSSFADISPFSFIYNQLNVQGISTSTATLPINFATPVQQNPATVANNEETRMKNRATKFVVRY